MLIGRCQIPFDKRRQDPPRRRDDEAARRPRCVLWAWPLVNVYNRRLVYEKVPGIVMAGPVPAAPVNRLGMLTNYIVPEERIVACPN